MLIRVAKSISKFPQHIVPILTSTVIECQRASLKRSSFEYASQLMQPENRQKVVEKFRRKIEAIVRRKPQEEKEEDLSPCPICQFEISETVLDCPSCKNYLPFCATSGQHMRLDDWCVCPSCTFPSLYSKFLMRIKTSKTCCMCKQTVELSQIVKLTPAQATKQLKGVDPDAASKSTQLSVTTSSSESKSQSSSSLLNNNPPHSPLPFSSQSESKQ
jgi:WD repeat-containing protein 19